MKNSDFKNYIKNDFDSLIQNFISESNSFNYFQKINDHKNIYIFLLNIFTNEIETNFKQNLELQKLPNTTVESYNNDLNIILNCLKYQLRNINNFTNNYLKCEMPFDNIRLLLKLYIEINNKLVKEIKNFATFFHKQYYDARYRSFFILWNETSFNIAKEKLFLIINILNEIISMLNKINEELK